MTGCGGFPFGKSGEIFRVPRKGEARAIEHGFGDGVGHHCSRRARFRECYGAFDRPGDERGGGAIGPSGNNLTGPEDREHRERIGEAARSLADLRDNGKRRVEPECAGPRREHGRVADQDEGRDLLALPRGESAKRNIRSDPGGIADGKRKRPFEAFDASHGASASTKRAPSGTR